MVKKQQQKTAPEAGGLMKTMVSVDFSNSSKVQFEKKKKKKKNNGKADEIDEIVS